MEQKCLLGVTVRFCVFQSANSYSTPNVGLSNVSANNLLNTNGANIVISKQSNKSVPPSGGVSGSGSAGPSGVSGGGSSFQFGQSPMVNPMYPAHAPNVSSPYFVSGNSFNSQPQAMQPSVYPANSGQSQQMNFNQYPLNNQ